MTEHDLHWLAGLLEGEGAFFKGPPSKSHVPRVAIESTDEDVVARVASLCGATYHRPKKRQEHWKQSYRVVLKGKRAVELMRLLYPLMGIRRRQQIDVALQSYKVKSRTKLTRGQVEVIRGRLLRGDKQEDIATEYGVHRTTVTKINTGVRWNWH
jgi:hypothetical protein